MRGVRARSQVHAPPVSRYYQELDAPHIDYGLVPLSGSYLHVRGPALDPTRPYIACVGAAQTFGRFCARPFPTLLAERLGMQVLNLSDGGTGPGWLDRPEFLDRINGACLVVAQVLSARSEGNSLFDNSASGGHLGFRKRDGQRMTFIEFFRDLVATESQATIERAVAETRANFVRHAHDVLAKIRPPKVSLWFSVRSPDYRDRPGSAYGYLSDYPHFVNRAIVDELRSAADAYVECTSRAGLPQRLWQATAPIEGTQLVGDHLENHYYPSPEMHVAAANLLEPACRNLLARA